MTRSTKQKLTSLTSIGIDIGKNTFHLVGFDGLGKIALRRKIKRLSLVSEFKKLPRCIVGMEACLSAHFAGPCAAWDSSRASCRRNTPSRS